MKTVWGVDVPYACFAFVVRDGVVVEVANIAGWMVGKRLDKVVVYWRKKGVAELISAEGGQAFVVRSGGQTGADRGALDAAIEMDVLHRGWCPAGRRAEDGSIPLHYNLQECESSGYHLRTELNVAESDGTVIFTYGSVPTGGSSLTIGRCLIMHKPWVLVDLTQRSINDAVLDVVALIKNNRIYELNVAGNRESKSPGIQELVRTIMVMVLGRVT